MGKYVNEVNYKISTSLDASGLSKLQSEIQKTQDAIRILQTQELIGDKQASQAIQTIQKLQNALNKSFNPKLGMLDMTKLSSSLKASNTDLVQLQSAFNKAGMVGQQAFNDTLGRLGKLDTGLKSTSKAADKLFNTISNTVRWGIISHGFNAMMDGARQAVEYVKELDDSLTQIMLVTDYSREQMNQYAQSANEAAKALGSTTTAMTNASLVFAQQGFNLEQSDQLAQLSTKLANASQQETSATSDQITALMNAYNLNGDMAELSSALDSWAEVANVSAADVAEIAQATQKVASTASATGVTMDQLNGQIAAIESVTREAPEQIGNGLKTIYARFSDLKAGETLEDGVSLGQVTSQLESIGVKVLDGEGQMRGVGDIMEDLMIVWQSIDSTQKAAISQTLAGKYQLSRFEALMNRSDLYEEYKGASENADGTLDIMSEKHLDSLNGKLNVLQATFEDLLNSIFETDSFYPLIDGLTYIIGMFDNLIDAVGGGGVALTAFAGIATKMFSGQLSGMVNNVVNNRNRDKIVALNQQNRLSSLNDMGIQSTKNGSNDHIIDLMTANAKNERNLNKEQITEVNKTQDEIVATHSQWLGAQEKITATVNATNAALNEGLQTSKEFVRVLTEGDKILGIELTDDFIERSKELAMDPTMLQDKDLLAKHQLNEQQLFSTQTDFLANQKIYTDKKIMQAPGIQNTNKEALTSLQNSIKKTAQAVYDFNLDIATTDEIFEEAIKDMSQDARELLTVFREFNNLTFDDLLNDFDKVSNAFNNVVAKNKIVIDAVDDAANGKNIITSVQGASDLNNLMGLAQAREDNARARAQEEVKSAERQLDIQSVIDMTSAVTELIFAWHSFQSLGSIWSNEDLSTGEKITQTILNLAMTLPTVIQAISTLNTLTKNLKISEAFSSAITSIASMGTALKGATTAAAGAKVASLGLAGGLKALGSAALKALGPFGILFTIIGAFASIKGFLDGQEAERLENITEAATNAKSSLDSLSTNADSFQELYQGFKDGEVSSDQLKASADQLNNTLDDQNLKVLAAAGNWDAYSEALAAAQKRQTMADIKSVKAERDEKADSANDAIDRVQTQTSTYDRLQDGSMTATSALGELIQQEGHNFSNLVINQSTDKVKVTENTNMEDAVAELQAFVAAIDSNADLLSTLTADQRAELENLRQSALDQINNEDIQTVITNDETMGAGYANLYKNDEAFQYTKGQDPEDYAEQIKLALHDKGVEASSTLIDAFLDGMASVDPDLAKARADGLAAQSEADTGYKPGDTFDNELTSEEAQQRVAGLELEGSFEDYQTSVIAANSELQELEQKAKEAEDSLESLGKAQEKAKDEFGEGSKEYEEASKALKDAEKASDKYNNELDSLTAKIIESEEGAKDLSENFEENVEVLQNADTTSADYTNTINDMSKDLGHMLNLDMSGWTQEQRNAFVGNADNIELMRQALNGSAEALQQLRSEAAEQILINAGLDPNTEPDLFNEMQNIIAMANALLPDIEAGASIDDTVFTEQLNHMINNALAAGASINDIMNMLNGMGIEADVTMVSEPVGGYATVPKVGKGTTGSNDTAAEQGLLTTEGKYWSGTMDVPRVELSNLKKVSPSKGSYRSPSGGGGRGGGGGGKKGGGGGGGGKAYEAPENKDPIDNEIDRYERVNAELGKTSAEYEKLNGEQDRLIGNDLIENIQKQNDLLIRQIELYKQKLEIQKAEAQELKNELAGYGVAFNNEGFMTNYVTIHQQLIDEVNRLGQQYSSLGSEAAQEDLDKRYEAAEKRLEEFEEAYQRYDELISSEMADSIQQIEDMNDAIEDLKIGIFETAIAALDNIKEIQDALDEFNQSSEIWFEENPFAMMEESASKLEKYFDDASVASNKYYDELIARNKEYLTTADTQEAKDFYKDQIAKLQNAKNQAGKGSMEYGGTGYFDMSMSNLADIMAQIQQYEQTGSSSIFGENSAALYETAKTIFDQATDTMSEYKDLVNEMHDNIIDSIDYMFEEAEKRMDAYEAITDELEHQADIIEMLHGDQAYDQLNQVLGAQQENYKAQISELQQQQAIWKDMLDSMEKGSEEYDMLQEKIRDTQSEINDLVTDSLENLQQQYQNTVNKITNSWTDNLLGTDLEWMQTEWELINRNADYYLDEVNKAYNIQKLQAKYLELLDGSNDLGIQQKITAQMKEQLAYLRDKTNLSEYDVQYANAQLEILQKRIALEEAQRNKSQMKLRRDSQGNYSYVYTANEGDVRDAEGNLLDAQNNAYNMSKDQMQQTQADALGALTDAKAMIDNIWADANLTLEEKKKRTETIINSLKEYIAATSEQLSTSEKNIINDFIGMMDILTEENSQGLEETYQEIINDNTDAFDQIDTRWQTSLTDWMLNLEEFNTNTDSMFENLVSNAEDYQEQIDSVGSLIGQNFNDMSSSIQDTADKTKELAENTQEFINTLKDMSGEVQANEATMQKYRDMIKDANNEMKAYQNQVNELGNKLTSKERENANLKNELQAMKDKYEGSGAGSGNGGAGGGGGGGAANAKVGSRVGYRGQYYYDSWGKSPAGRLYAGVPGGVVIDKWSHTSYGGVSRDTGGYKVHIKSADGRYGDLGWISPSQMFDTGGYTGTWSDGMSDAKNGKLAWLHEKELVLNSTDTANILTAVKAVRSMADIFKSQVLGAIGNSDSIFGAGSLAMQPQDVNQQVHITAEFPNASSANEIEQAMLSLNDRAIQYAFKNVK